MFYTASFFGARCSPSFSTAAAIHGVNVQESILSQRKSNLVKYLGLSLATIFSVGNFPRVPGDLGVKSHCVSLPGSPHSPLGRCLRWRRRRFGRPNSYRVGPAGAFKSEPLSRAAAGVTSLRIAGLGGGRRPARRCQPHINKVSRSTSRSSPRRATRRDGYGVSPPRPINSSFLFSCRLSVCSVCVFVRSRRRCAAPAPPGATWPHLAPSSLAECSRQPRAPGRRDVKVH